MKKKKIFYDKNTNIITIREIEEPTKFKEKLKENKIYFDTIIISLLTIIGLILTIFTIIIYNQQLKIEKALAMPIINLSYDTSEDIINKVIITNYGGKIKDIVVKVYPFIYGNIDTYDEPYIIDGIRYSVLHKSDFMLPLDKTLITNISYNNIQGVLATIEINDDSLIMNDIYNLKDIINYSEDTYNIKQIQYLEVQYFLFVSYTDILGNETSNYYYCNTGIHINFQNPKNNKTALGSRVELLQEQTSYQAFLNNWLNGRERDHIYKSSEDDSEIVRVQKLEKAILNPDNFNSEKAFN